MKIDLTKYTRKQIGAMLDLMFQQQEEANKAYSELTIMYYSEKTIYKDNTKHRLDAGNCNDGRQS